MDNRVETGAKRFFFGRRLLAFWGDLLLIFLLAWGSVKAATFVDIYLPFELTYLLLAAVYLACSLYVWGATPAKAAFGLEVHIVGRGPVRLLRIVVRETVGKVLSVAAALIVGGGVFFAVVSIRSLRHIPYALAIPTTLGLGAMLFVAALQRKRAVHDLLTGTCVVSRPAEPTLMKPVAAVSIAVLLFVVYTHAHAWYVASDVMGRMNVKEGYRVAAIDREPADLVEVNTLSEEDEADLAQWLDDNGQDPVEYAVRKAKEHQLVIFGEQHDQRQTLALLNEMIPVLHERAGVTCIAMEAFMATENQNMHKLVTASAYDHDEALNLARRMDTWTIWGHQGYYDVFETVWKLNQTIPSGRPKVRVIGIGLPIDMPSLAMLGLQESLGSNVPWWEKLRFVRMAGAMPAMTCRDAFMARELEKEIIEKNERGILLVGAMHSMIRCPRAGKVDNDSGRMGFMIARKYPKEVFQIVLHHESSSEPDAELHNLLERVMARRNCLPVGFDVEGGPFALIRDDASLNFRDERMGFADWATGYIFLVRLEQIQRCEWVPNYVSQEMFLRNKPFYQSFGEHFGHEIRNAADVNTMFAEAL